MDFRKAVDVIRGLSVSSGKSRSEQAEIRKSKVQAIRYITDHLFSIPPK